MNIAVASRGSPCNTVRRRSSRTRTRAAMAPPTEIIRAFTSVRGEQLKGSFVRGGDNSPVVVLAHGYTSNRNSCKFAQIAAALASAGISSFRFDHPMAIGGLSERQGSFRMGNHKDEVDDIHAAVTFLRDNGETVVGVLGHSKGGTYSHWYSCCTCSPALGESLTRSLSRMQRHKIRRGAWGRLPALDHQLGRPVYSRKSIAGETVWRGHTRETA